MIPRRPTPADASPVAAAETARPRALSWLAAVSACAVVLSALLWWASTVVPVERAWLVGGSRIAIWSTDRAFGFDVVRDWPYQQADLPWRKTPSSPVGKGVSVSYPFLIMMGTIAPLIWAKRCLVGSGRTEGHCRHCGYDLRATPERCPECGRKRDAEGR